MKRRFLFIILACLAFLLIFLGLFMVWRWYYTPTLSIAINRPMDSFDIQQTDDIQHLSLERLVYEGLYGLSKSMQVIPILAEFYTVQQGGRVYTFSLRHDVLFHDGTPLSADSVIASLMRYRSLHPNDPLLATIKDMEALNAHTLVVSHHTPNPSFIASLADPRLGIMGENGAGTGAFLLHAIKDDGSVLLTAYEHHWRYPLHPKGIQRIVVYPIESSAQRIVALKAGQVDLVFDVHPSDASSLQGVGGFVLHKSPSMEIIMLLLPFSSAPLRHAIARSINREAFVNEALGGYGMPVHSLIPHSPLFPYATGKFFPPSRNLLSFISLSRAPTIRLADSSNDPAILSFVQNTLTGAGFSFHNLDSADTLHLIRYTPTTLAPPVILQDLLYRYDIPYGARAQALLADLSSAGKATERIALYQRLMPMLASEGFLMPIASPFMLSASRRGLVGVYPLLDGSFLFIAPRYAEDTP